MSKDNSNANKKIREELASRVAPSSTPTPPTPIDDTSLTVGDTQTFRSGKAKDLSTKGEHQSRMKCSECGKSYLGQKNSSTCGDKCRQRKSRG